MKTLRYLSLIILLLQVFLCPAPLTAQSINQGRPADRTYLDSRLVHGGDYTWKMCKAGDTKATAEQLSLPSYDTSDWLDAIVPGTVLTSLVKDGIYPDPYYGTNNKLSEHKIPDIDDVGRDFYTYWFRTEFDTPAKGKSQHIWLHPAGINYRAEIWLNGHLVSTMNGMFAGDDIDITDFVNDKGKNALAVLVHPIDIPGKAIKKKWGAVGENQNGGNGLIGLNVTQLMTIGWDFYYSDGIRDRNTGIWRSITLYTTGAVALRHPFVKTRLDHPNYDVAHETISVEVYNPSNSNNVMECEVKGDIPGEGISFVKKVKLARGGHQTIAFTSEDFPQLTIRNPRLWWPKNKGPQNMYQLKLSVSANGQACDSLSVRFGIREITTTRETPDHSKLFVVNGRRIFIRGTNWLPEAMLRTSDERMAAELRYTAQSGVNLLRLWGGGIAESDYFYQLCDEMGLLVWQEFWMTGDTRHPHDEDIYLANVESTVKRIRNHPSLAFYVASNESSEVSGTRELIDFIDGTRPYQTQSECDGIHDGSPYKQVNPMLHYENTASDRGSRVDGFNPEYGAPTLPLASSLHEMMPEQDLWPINKTTWDYLDGDGFHLMSTTYTDLTNQYGAYSTIDEYAKKAQLVGAMNSKSIWEVWNYNKLDYGDRFCSGLLFWYHNVPCPLVCARMWDYSLEPTASLYHTMHSLEPLHVQFDYLKNTVSVINDYLQAFKDYTVTAQIFDMNSRKVSEQSVLVNIPADGCADDVLTLTFPGNISQVHFINLQLKDQNSQIVSENFYWRSKDRYLGRRTLTGPCTSGFESLASMPRTHLKISCRQHAAGHHVYYDVTLRNDTKQIAFFNQLQLFDGTKHSVRPAFYSDNFFTLLPEAVKKITIEVSDSVLPKNVSLHLSGWNVPDITIHP